MKNFIFLMLLFVFLAYGANAAQIAGSVNRNPIPEGEVFVLTLKADKTVNAVPDLSVLNNGFQVYSTSVMSSSRIVNNNAQSSTEWQIALMAKNTGEQEIPAIHIGDSSSSPIKINVVKGKATDNSNHEKAVNESPYSISASIENVQQKWYVQQQILYNVTIKDAGGLQGGEPVFNTDSAKSWIIKSLGQPEINLINEQDRQYRQIVFKYALFPQKSGKLNIPAVQFNGYALQPDSNKGMTILSSDIFGFSLNLPSIFGVEVPVNLHVPAQEIEILPVPSAFSGKWWLPAEGVKLNAQWMTEKQNFRVGEPVTRQISLQAEGVTDSQLPDIIFTESPAFKQYPEKSVRKNFLKDETLVAQQTVVNVYIPEKSGNLLVPEVSVNWFDIKTGKPEKAIIPAEEIYVQGEGILPVATENTINQKLEDKIPQAEKNVDNLQNLPKELLFFVSFLAFMLGILLSWLFFKRRLPNVNEKPQCEPRKYPDYIIQKAFNNDFRSLRDGLVSWATGYFPEQQINNLKDVAAAVNNPAFSEQINIVIAKLYNPHSQELWNPKVFKDVFFNSLRQGAKSKKNKHPLPPLYE